MARKRKKTKTWLGAAQEEAEEAGFFTDDSEFVVEGSVPVEELVDEKESLYDNHIGTGIWEESEESELEKKVKSTRGRTEIVNGKKVVMLKKGDKGYAEAKKHYDLKNSYMKHRLESFKKGTKKPNVVKLYGVCDEKKLRLIQNLDECQLIETEHLNGNKKPQYKTSIFLKYQRSTIHAMDLDTMEKIKIPYKINHPKAKKK